MREWMHDVLPMVVSVALGTMLGWERQVERKPAGLRTHTLVCLGTTLFVLTARHAAEMFSGGSDPTRIIHGVVTGVGFLGAGSILRTHGSVHGLTTAASVWIVAAIGAAAGVEAYPLAIAGAVLALIVLRLYGYLDRQLTPRDEDPKA